MKIKDIQVDGETVFSLSSEDLFLLKDEMPVNLIEDDIKRRVKWIIENKCENLWNQFRNKWILVLMKDLSISEVPSDKKAFINLVMSRSEYMDKDARDAESMAILNSKAKVL